MFAGISHLLWIQNSAFVFQDKQPCTQPVLNVRHITVGCHKSDTFMSLNYPFLEISFILFFFNKPTTTHAARIEIQFLISSYTLFRYPPLSGSIHTTISLT
jgi:hypothetical protein